jgi:hypothetical protein
MDKVVHKPDSKGKNRRVCCNIVKSNKSNVTLNMITPPAEHELDNDILKHKGSELFLWHGSENFKIILQLTSRYTWLLIYDEKCHNGYSCLLDNILVAAVLWSVIYFLSYNVYYSYTPTHFRVLLQTLPRFAHLTPLVCTQKACISYGLKSVAVVLWNVLLKLWF